MTPAAQAVPSDELERKFERKTLEISYFKNQANEMQAQIQLLTKIIQDLDTGQKSLSAADQLQNGTLMPLGAGVFAKAKAEKTGTVLMDVGARTILEKKPEDASAILQQRKTAAEKNLGEVTAAFERVLARIHQLNAEAEQMAADAQTR